RSGTVQIDLESRGSGKPVAPGKVAWRQLPAVCWSPQLDSAENSPAFCCETLRTRFRRVAKPQSGIPRFASPQPAPDNPEYPTTKQHRTTRADIPDWPAQIARHALPASD